MVLRFPGTDKPKCSGVAVSEHLFLTANHCVDPEGRPVVSYTAVDSGEVGGGRLLRRDVERDLAWVQTGPAMVPVSLAAPEVGELVTLERPLWGGARTGLVREQSGAFLLLGIPVDHGDSGSPVFNGYGELVGITVTCSFDASTPDPIDCDPRGPSAAAALTPGDSR